MWDTHSFGHQSRQKWVSQIHTLNHGHPLNHGHLLIWPPIPTKVGVPDSPRFIAYNIIRRLMQESAITFDESLDRISFKGTADTFRAWRGVLTAAGHAKAVDAFVDMLIICALDKLSHRPGRHEPRAVKKRPKPYSLLTAPRNVFTVAASRRNKGRPKRKLIPVPPILCA